MVIIIKSLSKPHYVEVNDVALLMAQLQNYRGLSVAIHISKNGMTKPHFVDVLVDGTVVESYGEQREVSIEYFTSTFQAVD